MNIFKRFLSYIVPQINSTDRNVNRQARYQSIMRDSFSKSKALLNSTYFTCVNIISNTIAKNRITIYKIDSDGRKVRATDHKWYDTLASNPYQSLSAHKVIAGLYTNTYADGMGFLFIKEYDNNLNLVQELVPICKKLESVTLHEGKAYYKFCDINEWIPADKLIINYVISADGGITGVHPVDAAMNELTIQKQGEIAYRNFLEQGLQGLLYFKPDLTTMNPTDRNKFKEKYEELVTEFMGFHNAGKIPTIPPGFELKALSAQQLDYLQHNKYTVSQIGAIMGCPEILLGSTNTATIGKAEESILFFKNFTLSNVASLLIQDLNVKLLTKKERAMGYSIEFDWSGLYEADIITRANMASTLAQRGALSPFELQGMFNIPQSSDPNMKKHFIQIQNLGIEDYDEWKSKAAPIPDEKKETSTGSTSQQ